METYEIDYTTPLNFRNHLSMTVTSHSLRYDIPFDKMYLMCHPKIARKLWIFGEIVDLSIKGLKYRGMYYPDYDSVKCIPLFKSNDLAEDEIILLSKANALIKLNNL